VNSLANVADALGAVDAYCAAQQDPGSHVRDEAGMARRLIDAGHFANALSALGAALPNPAKSTFALADLRTVALDEMARREEAQVVHWSEFTHDLLKRLCPASKTSLRKSRRLTLSLPGPIRTVRWPFSSNGRTRGGLPRS
jgi:hypothetical protein